MHADTLLASVRMQRKTLPDDCASRRVSTQQRTMSPAVVYGVGVAVLVGVRDASIPFD
jgi:hypothetical protein